MKLRFKYSFPRAYFIFDNIIYTWCGWFGAQLESIEYKRIHAGTTRELRDDAKGFYYILKIVRSEREGFLRFRNVWTINIPDDLTKANEVLNKFKTDLSKFI